ncbi:MAG: diphosphomevalonate decarboxylase, partial [Lentisphaeria bacterium]
MNRQQFANTIIGDRSIDLKKSATAFAPSNIALCKYWGKRQRELNLPVNSSLSISLGEYGTSTTIKVIDSKFDEIFLNGNQINNNDSFAKKIIDFIDLLRQNIDFSVRVNTINNIPTAAGLASSASGFAALTLAINELLSLELSNKELSMLARLGSGSASRSIYDGFVVWNRGEREDGLDSFAEKLNFSWPGLCIGLCTIVNAQKSISSRDGMNRTVESSFLYQSWASQAEHDILLIKDAILKQDFVLLGSTAEHNSLSMHATMISAFPPVIYWTPESLAMINKIHLLRSKGLPLYFTMDAGPNIKLLFMKENEAEVLASFPDVKL